MTTAIGVLPANALHIGAVVGKGWWNVNHVPTGGCGGTSDSGANGDPGHRAVNTLSKLEVLAKVFRKQAHLHLNTDAYYDPGAAQATYLWPIFFNGTQISCSQVAGYVGQDQFHVFRALACNPNVSANWQTALKGFCKLPDSQVFSGTGPSPLFSTMLSSYGLSGYPGNRFSCFTPDGARSEERFYWPGLNVYFGKETSFLGKFKVTIDAITVDAGVNQQRVINPTTVVLMMSTWNTIGYTYAGTFGANWSYTTTGNDGHTILDLNKYASQVTSTSLIGGIVLNIGGKMQPANQYLTAATAQGCALNPDAKTAYDTSDNAVAESVDGALRNLFDNLAGKPYQTDVLCTAKQPPLCANLFRLTQTIWNSGPDHGTALIKQFIGQLLG